jgi:hypothetical protein
MLHCVQIVWALVGWGLALLWRAPAGPTKVEAPFAAVGSS